MIGDSMKEVILSADGDSILYLVPDEVADNLWEYCTDFCDNWMRNSPHGRKYKIPGGYCYNEKDFIDYLNEWVFQNQKSLFIKNLGWTELGDRLPEKYKKLPYFNF